jgi:hypothetical protein
LFAAALACLGAIAPVTDDDALGLCGADRAAHRQNGCADRMARSGALDVAAIAAVLLAYLTAIGDINWAL